MSSHHAQTNLRKNTRIELDEYKLDLRLLNLLANEEKACPWPPENAGKVIITMNSATRLIESAVITNGQAAWPILGVLPTLTFTKGFRPDARPSLSAAVERMFKSASNSVLNSAVSTRTTAPALSDKGEL